MWFCDNCWWVCSITPQPPADVAVSWLAKGSRLRPAQARDHCNMADVHWSFPAKNTTGSNRWVRCEPTLQASLRADGMMLRKLEAELATAVADIQTKDARIAALELAASAPESWSGYTGSSNYGGGGASASSSSWQWPRNQEPAKKGGWLNKMVAMLAAIYNKDHRRIEDLSRV